MYTYKRYIKNIALSFTSLNSVIFRRLPHYSLTLIYITTSPTSFILIYIAASTASFILIYMATSITGFILIYMATSFTRCIYAYKRRVKGATLSFTSFDLITLSSCQSY